MCEMTHSYVMKWLIHMCDMTHPYVWNDSFTCHEMAHSYVWHDPSICVKWLIHMSWNGSFICVTWPRRDSVVCATWRNHRLVRGKQEWDAKRGRPWMGVWLLYVWCDLFVCVAWLIHLNDVKHSYEWCGFVEGLLTQGLVVMGMKFPIWWRWNFSNGSFIRWRDAFIEMRWLNHRNAMTHS